MNKTSMHYKRGSNNKYPRVAIKSTKLVTQKGIVNKNYPAISRDGKWAGLSVIRLGCVQFRQFQIPVGLGLSLSRFRFILGPDLHSSGHSCSGKFWVILHFMQPFLPNKINDFSCFKQGVKSVSQIHLIISYITKLYKTKNEKLESRYIFLKKQKIKSNTTSI